MQMKLLIAMVFALPIGHVAFGQNIGGTFSVDFTSPNFPIGDNEQLGATGPNNAYTVLGTIGECDAVQGLPFPLFSTGNKCPALTGERGSVGFSVLTHQGPPAFSNLTLNIAIPDAVKKGGQILSLPDAAQTLGFYPTVTINFSNALGHIPTTCNVSGPVKSQSLLGGTLTIKIDTTVSGHHTSLTVNCDQDVIIINVEGLSSDLAEVIFQQLFFTVGTATPTISVTEAHFEQVVEDPKLASNLTESFDAVAGKSASFKIGLSGPTNANTLPGSVIVNVMSGGAVISSSSSVPLSKFDSSGHFTVSPDMMTGPNNTTFKPTTLMPSALSIQVVPSSDATGIVAGAPYTAMSLNVYQVNVPTIGFVQINSPFSACPGGNAVNTLGVGCYLSPNSNNQNIPNTLQSDKFMSAVFPVPDNSYSYSLGFVPSIAGTDKTFASGKIGMYEDYNQLEMKRRAGGFSRMVGIVSDSYIPALRRPGTTGITGWTPENPVNPVGLPTGLPSKSVFVVAGSAESVPHEIGHSFLGPGHLYHEVNGVQTYDGTPVNGYDATTRTGYFFPNPLARPIFSFMGPSNSFGGLFNGSSLYNYWVDNDTYSNIFSLVVNPPPGDPETIAVSGVLLEAGQFIAGPTMHLFNGTVTTSVPSGDVVVSLLDKNGQVLNQTAINSSFQAIIEFESGSTSGPSIDNTGVMSVVVELPFNSSATQIQISQNNNVLQKTNLNGQLLSGIISRIPVNAFQQPRKCMHVKPRDKNELKYCENFVSVDQRILNEEVAEAQKRLNGKNPREAIEGLKELIRKVEKLTSANYSIADNSELTQTAVIAQVHAIIEGLEPTENHEKGTGCSNGKK